MPSSLQEAINVSRRQEVYFKTPAGGGGGGESSMSMYNDDDFTSTKSLVLDSSASMNLSKLRRVASESENSMFFQSRVQATVAKPFISKLTHACVTQDDYTHDLSFNKWSGDVALLFVDISGYSKLAAALPGAHALADAVNGYFTPIVDIIVAAQGDVLKFAGDAIMVVWPTNSTSRQTLESCVYAALGCALDLQKKAGTYEVPSAPGTQLHLHIGCAVNRMDADVMMPPATHKRIMQQAFFFVGGPVLSGLEDIVDNCPPGCVAVSRDITSHFPLTNLKTHEAEGTDGCVLIVEEIVGTASAPAPSAEKDRSVSRLSCGDVDAEFVEDEGNSDISDEEELHEQLEEVRQDASNVDDYFVPPDVLSRLRLGLRTEDMAEMRDLVCLFIKKTGSIDITDWFEEVYEVLNAGRCPITQIIEDDKGVHVIASMNLYISEDGAADAAVQLAQRLVELEISCVVGIAAGSCFCGIVGSEKIHRWDITGAACVRACRLVQFASSNDIAVAVDKTVVSKMGDTTCVRSFTDSAAIKGSEDPVSVYTLSQVLDSPLSTIAAINDYVIEVHADKRELLRKQLINNTDATCGSALVVGGRMAGKKYLLLSSLYGTPFVSIIHRTPRECMRLDVLRTIARWFKYHHNQTLRDLACEVCSNLRQRHTSHALLLVLELIHTSITLGEHTAIVIDRAQFIDDASLRLIARCSRGEFCLNQRQQRNKSASSLFQSISAGDAKPKGRWIWLLSMTPQLQGQTIKKIDQLATLTVPPIKIGKIGVPELAAMFRAFAFWDYWTGNGEMELDKCDGLPGAYSNQLTVVGPQLFMRIMGVMRGRFEIQEAGMAIGKDGKIISGDFPESIFRMVTFRKACPQLLATHIQAFDVLHPRQQLVLKVLASIQHRVTMHVWTWKQVCQIASVFIPRTSSEMLLHDMLIMRDIMILEVDDKSENGEVRFVDHSMAEAVFETLTPAQLSHVCKKAIKAILVSFSGELCDLDELRLETLFLLASRVQGTEGCEQRNSFGKQLLRQHFATTAPSTHPTGSLYNSVEHRLAWHCEFLGIDPSEVAVEYPSSSGTIVVPKSLPHRTMTMTKESTMPLSVARAKCMEPPVIAGPIVGLFMSLVFRAISNHLVGCGGSERTHIPPGTGEAYLRIVDKFEKAVGSDAALPKTWREDEAALIGRLEAPINTTEELGTLCEDAVNWEASTIASRVARLMSFSVTLQALQPVEETDREACTALLRAFDFIKHVDSSTDPDTLPDAASKCLMALAISGWSSPFSYMIPARLREMWQAGWLPTFGLKGLIFMFILEACKGPLLITRTAVAC